LRGKYCWNVAADGRKGQVAPHKRVRAIDLVAEIPKAPSGKILRRLLRDRDREP
jgi:acyl-coenzyme A synthetase/AMP-(fatty) acid ligase